MLPTITFAPSAAVGIIVAAAQLDAIITGTAVDDVAAFVRTDDHVTGIAGINGDAAAGSAVDQCRLAAADDQPCADSAVDDVAAGAAIETVRARPAIDRAARIRCATRRGDRRLRQHTKRGQGKGDGDVVAINMAGAAA